MDRQQNMNLDSGQLDDKSGRNTDLSLGQPTKANGDVNTLGLKNMRIEDTQRQAKSCYYEPVEPGSIISPKHISLKDKEKKTVAQCGVEDGDTLLLLLPSGGAEIQVSICNYIRTLCDTPEMMTVPTTRLILHLKEDIIKAIDDSYPPESRGRVHPAFLVLKNIDEITELEDTKILADYHKDDTILCVHAPSYNLSFRIPTYAKMKRVLFEPYNYTIKRFWQDLQRIKTEVEMPRILRGAVKKANGSLLYLLMDMDGMELNVVKSFRRLYRQVSFYDDDTLTDIYKMIDGTYPLNKRPSSFTTDVYDAAWARAFAPQIEAEATLIHGYQALRLFYFPVYDKVVSMGPISSLENLQAVKAKVCKMEGVEALHRIFTHKSGHNTTKNLEQHSVLFFHHFSFQFNPTLTLSKQCTDCRSRYIRVYVEWFFGKRSVPLAVLPNDTISTLKDRIEDEIMVPRPMQKLTFSGKVIEDNDITLKSVGITHLSTVELSSLWN